MRKTSNRELNPSFEESRANLLRMVATCGARWEAQIKLVPVCPGGT
jgi:hypothetical protein